MKGKYTRLTKARLRVEEGVSVSEAIRVFKDAVTAVAAEVVGYKPLSVLRNGNAW